jgi:DNA repair exonuclease SbcCD ATPase subunit
MKKHHYMSKRSENTQIQEQEQRIKGMQEEIRRNNEKLLKYQKASNELEIRMNNIQAIDKEIYKQLKSASTRDKELLERANGALLRGEPRENILRILEQIVIS